MDSISSLNSVSGIANLFRTLSAESPQFSAVLAIPKLKSALENGSPSDLVELSDEALQLQQLVGGNQVINVSSGANPLLSILSPGGSAAAGTVIAQALQTSPLAGATHQPISTSTYTRKEIAALFSASSIIEPLFDALG